VANVFLYRGEGHNELVGDLNGGGPILKLRSSDGSIRVTTIE